MRVFLLGAGVNWDAGLPSSKMLLDLVDERAQSAAWERYRDLHEKVLLRLSREIGPGDSEAADHSPGLTGRGDKNIQDYVDALRESDDPLVDELLRMVTQEISRLLTPAFLGNAGYFRGFLRLSEKTGKTVEIFTLNYDTCPERVLGSGVETGILGHGRKRTWKSRRFLRRRSAPSINLYKLRGSLNWHFNAAGEIYTSDSREPADGEMPVIVLGYKEKEEGRHPYPYRTCVRRFGTLSARADRIVSLGYGFGDRDINGMVVQALKKGNIKELVVVVGEFETERGRLAVWNDLREKLGHGEKITVLNTTAKKFLDGL